MNTDNGAENEKDFDYYFFKKIRQIKKIREVGGMCEVCFVFFEGGKFKKVDG